MLIASPVVIGMWMSIESIVAEFDPDSVASFVSSRWYSVAAGPRPLPLPLLVVRLPIRKHWLGIIEDCQFDDEYMQT